MSVFKYVPIFHQNIKFLGGREKYAFIYYTFYLITGVNPLKLTVKLKGELKVAYSSVVGVYSRGPNTIYQNWLQDNGTNAIWHDYDLQVGWIFGSQDNLGSDKTWFYSGDDVAGPQLAKNWYYHDGRPIDSEDILVQSLVESGFYNTTVVNPLKLIVNLKGKLKDALSTVEGIYIHGPNTGYENWLQEPGKNAIWYNNEARGWLFGSKDDLGSEKTWFYSMDDVAGPQAAREWEYDDSRPINSDDILVQSLKESGT